MFIDLLLLWDFMGIEESLDKFQKMKRQRIAYMVYELLEKGGEANLNEFKGSIAVNWGIRQKTQDEYIEDLKNAGAISVYQNKIVLKWDRDKAKQWLENQGIDIRKVKQIGQAERKAVS
ncbi:MAG: hypothetical protein N0A00_10125 [Candidatus Bathyarchaeota archaeon]|nr:hypothetical protein [Candidatus Bathyarchaeota archaeon]